MNILESKITVFIAALMLGSLSSTSLSAAPQKVLIQKTNSNKTQMPTSYTTSNAMKRGKGVYRSKELIVRFKSNVTQTFRAQKVSQYGSSVIKRMTIGKTKKYVVVKIKSGESIDQVYSRFKSDPNVASVDYNPIYKAYAAPNDPDYGAQWGLNNTGQVVNGGAPGTSGSDMGLELAWNVVLNGDCSAVTVAVLDQGVDYTHSDLAANMSLANMFDFVANDGDAYPAHSGENHGTHVAGIIGAVGDNGTGTTGVCWKAKILPIRVLSAEGGDAAGIASGITHAVNSGAKVINMSLGGSALPPQALIDAMDYARTSGVVVIIAAGNTGTDNDVAPSYPCAMTQDNIVCVAAMDQDYKLAGFSNFGLTSVDVGAPGTATLSTVPGRTVFTPSTNPNAGWTLAGGWAAPLTCSALGTNGTTQVLSNPATICAVSGEQYSNTANDDAYKTFDLSVFSGLKGGSVRVEMYLDLEFLFNGIDYDLDFLKFGSTPTAGTNPFTAATSPFSEFVGNTNGFLIPTEIGIDSSCFVGTCSLGFKLLSTIIGTATTGNGTFIKVIDFTAIPSASTTREYSQGTSMAAPHVAGLAALIIARNPSFTYTDTINAIKNGGVANGDLSTTTTTGRTVSAIGSLQYTSVPTGLSVSTP